MLDKLNIHYSSTTPPISTSKLWVKADVSPGKVIITKELASQPQTVSLLSTYQYDSTVFSAYCQVDNKLYFGYSSIPTNSSEIMKLRYYDLISHTFGTTNIVLPSITYTTYAAIGHTIYMFGGELYNSSGNYQETTNRIYAIDLDAETITLLDTVTGSSGHRGSTSAVIGDIIYIFGGYDSRLDPISTIYQFNSITKERTFVAYLPYPGAGLTPAAFTINNRIYLVGGDKYSGAHSDQIYIFDPTTLQITNSGITGLPHIITRGAAIGTDIYIFGGATYDGSTSHSGSRQVYRIDTVQNTISLLPTLLPHDNAQQIIGIINSDIYILAGIQSSPYTICQFHATVDLPENHLLLTDLGAYSWDLFSDAKLDVDIRPQKIYIGNAQDEAQEVTAALYINDQWQNL